MPENSTQTQRTVSTIHLLGESEPGFLVARASGPVSGEAPALLEATVASVEMSLRLTLRVSPRLRTIGPGGARTHWLAGMLGDVEELWDGYIPAVLLDDYAQALVVVERHDLDLRRPADAAVGLPCSWLCIDAFDALGQHLRAEALLDSTGSRQGSWNGADLTGKDFGCSPDNPRAVLDTLADINGD